VGKKHLRILAVCATLAAIASACSSSTKSPASSPAGSSSTKAAAGTPIKVETLAVPPIDKSEASEADGLNVAIQVINASGGVDGRPIQVIRCSNLGDANTTAACARNAVSDSKVVAWLGGSGFGATADPIFDAGALASIGGSVYSPVDATSKTSFTITAGDFDTIISAKAAVQLLSAKRIGVPYIDLPAGAELAPFINTVIKPLGGKTVGAIAIPQTAADITPFVAQEISAKPDVIVDGLLIDQFTEFIRGMAQQGGKVPFLVSTGVYDAQQVKSNLAGVNQNIYFVDEFDHHSPGYSQFLSEMKKYAPSAPTNDSTLQSWMSVELFAYAAEHAASITRQGILAEMNSLSNYTIDGLVPGLNFTARQTGFGGAFPRMFNDSVWLERYQNGQEVPVGSYQQIHFFG
jgi:ABC-type branched-subunit amino acid transport system substrate-binding protein